MTANLATVATFEKWVATTIARIERRFERLTTAEKRLSSLERVLSLPSHRKKTSNPDRSKLVSDLERMRKEIVATTRSIIAARQLVCVGNDVTPGLLSFNPHGPLGSSQRTDRDLLAVLDAVDGVLHELEKVMIKQYTSVRHAQLKIRVI